MWHFFKKQTLSFSLRFCRALADDPRSAKLSGLGHSRDQRGAFVGQRASVVGGSRGRFGALNGFFVRVPEHQRRAWGGVF